MTFDALPRENSLYREGFCRIQRPFVYRQNSYEDVRTGSGQGLLRQRSEGHFPLRIWKHQFKGPTFKRQLTFSESWEFVNQSKGKLCLPNIRLPSQLIGNSTGFSELHKSGISCQHGTSLHPHGIVQGPISTDIKFNNWQSFTTEADDRSGHTTNKRNLDYKRVILNGYDRSRMKGISLKDLKVRSCVNIPERNEIADKTGHLNLLRKQTENQRELNVIYNRMSSLKLDNRQDMASNDHARNHNRRQQKWIRSEQVKNWRRSNNIHIRKNGCGTSDSSGQKSDVISGNSDETLQTASSSSEEQSHILPSHMDLERRQTVDKCLKWMDSLPQKFTGMHIFTTNGGE